MNLFNRGKKIFSSAREYYSDKFSKEEMCVTCLKSLKITKLKLYIVISKY